MAGGELHQRVNTRLGVGAGKHRQGRERELRVGKRQAALKGQPSTPPRRPAREGLGFAVVQSQQDRQRVLQTDARQLGGRGTDLQNTRPRRLKDAMKARGRAALSGHANRCSQASVPGVRAFLADNLTADGYAVTTAASRDDAIAQLRHDSPDLVLVDVNGQTLGLVDWLRDGDDTLRGCASDLPVVVASSHAGELECVRLLERGADDVIAKPFSYPELRARIAAVLRRTQPRQAPPVTIAGPVRIDHHQRTVHVHEQPVALSDTEYRLLCCLAAEPTRVFTRQELMRDVWGYHCPGRSRTLDSHAHRLRQRLSSQTPLVLNQWGVGYRLIDSQ